MNIPISILIIHQSAHLGLVNYKGLELLGVVLDKNPLTIPPMDLNNIHVLETIKAGKSIYHKSL